VIEAVERSLRRLQTDYTNLYQIHAAGPGTPRGRDPSRPRPAYTGREDSLPWLLQPSGLAQSGVTSAIVEATSPEQFAMTLSALDVTLDDEEVTRCDEVWFELPRLRDLEVALTLAPG
jgi:aryl-alcohol dehydrogenase-like predicted oxidoreductase